MKKLIALLLVLTLLTLNLAACGKKDNAASTTEKPSAESESPAETDPVPHETIPQDPNHASAGENGSTVETRAVDTSPFTETDGKVSYVLIYNPHIYDESKYWNETLNTGSLGDQIDISMHRADELEPLEPEFLPFTQPNAAELFGGREDDLNEFRAGGLQPDYQVGDTHDFYVTLGGTDAVRTLNTFDCLYSGEHCCVWSLGDSITTAAAEGIGTEFDEVIYETDVRLFGEPRYADEGGKVHLLYYPLGQGLLGYFSLIDLFATGEWDDATVSYYSMNLDHAIVHLNSLFAQDSRYEEMVYSTTAHEFQHLINASDIFTRMELYYSSTWLNEAMSGYVEEYLFPGVKNDEGHYDAFCHSERIRHGQSMFNFETDSWDIGVYGSVFLFSEYLADIAGEEVFHGIHDYWRYSFSPTLDDAESIYYSVPEEMQEAISEAYVYPDTVRFDTNEQEWLSKLILDYYLSLLCFDEEDPETYANVEAQTLLYDEINPADIEGGGRVIVATVNGTYEIPEDADYGLLYIGLDEHFRPITNIIYK